MIKSALKSKALLAFSLGFILFILVIIPELISTGGVILGCGDYIFQSIPFVFHIRSSILEGNLLWDFSNGIGNQFLSSYAYYNLFSPFSFIYLLVPDTLVCYSIPYVTALKYAVGTMIAYFYLKRYVSSPHYAVIGGLLYAFSTFTAYNWVFHFLDVIVLFPLMLLAMDELCINRRKGVFALSVALMAYVNYYFFFGQAVFLILYYFVGYFDKESGRTVKSLFYVLTEAIIGCLMAMPLFIPVILTLISSDKATTTLAFSDYLLYDDIFHYLKIFQSAFMIPDPFGFTSLFPENDRTYPYGVIGASVAAYIPLFSAAGVISYIWKKRKHWQSYLLIICVVFAFVPVLNQAFSALNSSYYARWFYMPLIIGIMVSLKALDEKISFKPGIIVCVIVNTLFILYWLIFNPSSLPSIAMSNSSDYQNIVHFSITAISIILLVICIRLKRDKEYFPKLYIFSLVAIYMSFGIMTHYFLTGIYVTKEFLVDTVNFNEELPEGVDKDARFSNKRGIANYNLIWGIDSVMSFNSIYDSGVSEFLTETDFLSSKEVFSFPDISSRNICDLLSVRYFISANELSPEEENITFINMFDDYYVYENNNFIPMGFTYDTMISSECYRNIEDTEQKRQIYMKSLVVENPEEFSDILILDDENVGNNINETEYRELIERHKSETCYDLEKSSRGITGKINLKKENIVFFSISHNDSWKAYVDNEKTAIYKVNNGMIGIKVPAGEHKISLMYSIKGLDIGVVVFCFSVILFVSYIIILKRKEKENVC